MTTPKMTLLGADRLHDEGLSFCPFCSYSDDSLRHIIACEAAFASAVRIACQRSAVQRYASGGIHLSGLSIESSILSNNDTQPVTFIDHLLCRLGLEFSVGNHFNIRLRALYLVQQTFTSLRARFSKREPSVPAAPCRFSDSEIAASMHAAFSSLS